MKKNKWFVLVYVVTGTIFLGLAVDQAQAQISIEPLPFSKSAGTVDGCPGAYTGIVKMTNTTGTVPLTLITPPANTTSGTLTDISGLGSNYVSAACVMRESDYSTWCGTNNVTFPVSSGDQFFLSIYVKSSPTPTNGQPITAQIAWHN